jgi:hypothetical protein
MLNAELVDIILRALGPAADVAAVQEAVDEIITKILEAIEEAFTT